MIPAREAAGKRHDLTLNNLQRCKLIVPSNEDTSTFQALPRTCPTNRLYFRRPILPELSSDRRCHLADSAETMSAARETGMNIRDLTWMLYVKQPWAFSDGNERGSNPLRCGRGSQFTSTEERR